MPESIAGKRGERETLPGLVHISTSDTPLESVELEKEFMRLRRMKQTVITSARLHSEEMTTGGGRYRAAMITLTYRDSEEWEPKDITGMLKSAREYLRRKSVHFRYTWVLELTKRGRPHYHVMLWLPLGRQLPKIDKRGWWKKGLTRIEWARNPVGYLAKYASKGLPQGAKLPDGARICGTAGLTRQSRHEMGWWKCPSYVRDVITAPSHMRRAKGGGWLNVPTGEVFRSPWKFGGVSRGRLRLVKTDTITPDYDHLALTDAYQEKLWKQADRLDDLRENDRPLFWLAVEQLMAGKDERPILRMCA